MLGTGAIFFHQIITTIARSTRDAFGDYTTTAVYTNVPTRFVYDVNRIRGIAEDQEVDALAYIGPNYTLYPDDIVTFDGSNYRIIKLYNEYDLFGNVDHIKMTLRARN